jgi:archaellum biogenesis protein FlaJ (TadC family)
MNKLYFIIIISGILSALVLIVNFIYFRTLGTLYTTINIIGALVFAFPIVMLRYAEYRKYKQIEEMFPVFLRDFVEAMRGGQPVPQSLKAVTKNDYGALTPYVKKMAAQTDWGVPVEIVMLKFAKASKSKLIARVISSIVESHKFGGNLADTFEALSKTSLEVERLKEERKLYLNSQMITGYIIFFVFLAVILGMGRFLIPSLSEISSQSLTGGQPTTACSSQSTIETCKEDALCEWDSTNKRCQPKLINEYKNVFRNLIVIQGLFAGLSVGKMSEGAIISGVKHSLFMMFVGIIAFILVG